MTEDGRRTADSEKARRPDGVDRPQPPFASPPVAPAPGLPARVRLIGLRAIGRAYRHVGSAGSEPRSVLLIRPDHLGDMLFATPAFRMLRQALPHARLTLLAGPWSQAVVAGNPDLDQVLACRFPGFERQPKTSLLAPYRLLAETARGLRGRFDAAVILRFDHWWGAWLAAAASIPRRIGYAQPETRPFLTDALTYRPDRHEVAQNATLAAALAGIHPPDDRPGALRFTIGADAHAWAAGWLAERGIPAERRLIAIHPGAGATVKQWPAAAWAAVATRLAAAYGAQIVLTGHATERPLAQAIAAQLGQTPLDAAGQTDLAQLAGLLARCALALGSDSGPLHLAVAVGTPTIHLYGPVSAAKFGPWGDPTRHVVLKTTWPCAPCNRLDWPADVLTQHACMPAISVEEVLRAAHAILQQPGAPP
jgi:heptosyltransferase-2/heptosyltransferase-3